MTSPTIGSTRPGGVDGSTTPSGEDGTSQVAKDPAFPGIDLSNTRFTSDSKIDRDDPLVGRDGS